MQILDCFVRTLANLEIAKEVAIVNAAALAGPQGIGKDISMKARAAAAFVFPAPTANAAAVFSNLAASVNANNSALSPAVASNLGVTLNAAAAASNLKGGLSAAVKKDSITSQNTRSLFHHKLYLSTLY